MSDHAVTAHGITKRFGASVALEGARLELAGGEIHAIMGENGSGKSTLLAILSGALTPDRGTIRIHGAEGIVLDPGTARAARIAIVHQEPQLASSLTVGENILMGSLPTSSALVNWREVHRRSQAILDELGIALDARAPVSSLSIGRRQMVEIAKGLVQKPKILLLDEATSALDDADTAVFFSLLRKLRAQGAAIAFVSHRMAEVMALADRVTVLRDGRDMGTFKTCETDERTLVSLMVGRDLKTYWHKAAVQPGELLLEVADVSRGPLEAISLTVRAGEVVGLAGLVGSGRSALMRTLMGVKPPRSGTVSVAGRPVSIDDPRHAHRYGIGYVPEDRKSEGLIMNWSLARNAALSAMNMRSPLSIITNGFDRQQLERGSQGLKIKARDPDQSVRELSGGNQQKVVIARELAKQPDILLLDEPTRGVDVGAKEDIYAQLAQSVRNGMGLLIASSELQELIGVCDRIYVLFHGHIVAELAAEGASEETIAYWASGAHEVDGRREQIA